MARILIVEDDASVSKFYCRLVEGVPGPHDCLVARTSLDAIALLERHKVDLILLDVQLAEATSGRRFLVHCHHRCEGGAAPPIPVVIISAVEERDLEGLRKAYPFVKRVFTKPFDMDELANFIGDLLTQLTGRSGTPPS